MGDTIGAGELPAGFGSLRQDDVALRLQVRGTLMRAIPLDESIIRTLSPDSYAALHDLRLSRAAAIKQLADRRGIRGRNVWYVSYYGIEPDARFDPTALSFTSAGLEHRPLELLPLSAGFGEQRVRQRETQTALVLFDDSLDAAQPLVLSVESARNEGWASVLRSVERERALIRSRAARTSGRP
ncbi:MAG: hypothetical protein NVS1B4_25620 [Gemmatimonadaceae bacterium]